MEQWVISDFRKVHCVCGHRQSGDGRENMAMEATVPNTDYTSKVCRAT